ncbi:MAG TPA: hypothetical protein VGM56_33270 [Byssovorax sp.]
MADPSPPAKDTKRRLPLLQPSEAATDEQEADEARPPWHWSVLGAVLVFLAWLPLAMLVNGPLAAALLPGGGAPGEGPPASIVALNVAAFAVAALLAGGFVTRVGADTEPRHAAFGGAGAAAVAWAIGAAGANARTLAVLALALPVLAGLGAGGAYLGGRVGQRWRRRRTG